MQAYGIPNIEGKIKQIEKTAEVPKTVFHMQRIVKEHANQLEQLSKMLDTGEVYSTCENVWNFIRKHIDYRDDAKVIWTSTPYRTWNKREEGDENLQNPNFTFYEGAGDCDDMSIFAGAILYNLNIKFAFKVGAYNKPDEFEHVYVIAYDEQGKEIIIDCVPEIPAFNYEQKPILNFEIYPMTMKTYQLSGLTDIEHALGVKLKEDQRVEPIPYALTLIQKAATTLKTKITENPDFETYPEAVKEVMILEVVEESIEDPETLAAVLQKAAQDSMFSKVYEELIDMLLQATDMPDTTEVGQFFARGLKGLGFLNFLGDAISSVDKLFGGEKKRLQEQRRIEEERTRQVQAQAEAQKELLLIEQQTALINQNNAAKKNSSEPTAEGEEEEKPKSFIEKNWIWLVGGVGAVLLIFIVWYMMKPKKAALKGVRRRRKPTATPRRRRTTVAGVKRRTISRPRRKPTAKRKTLRAAPRRKATVKRRTARARK